MRRRVAKVLSFFLVAILAISLIGCEKKEEEKKLVECETGVFDFAVRLLQNSQEKDANVSISPLSVLNALSMTANGAGGETLSQMENVLGMSIPELNAFMKQYVEQLPRDEAYRLNLANAIWFDDDSHFTVNQDFLQTNADFYNAEIHQSPFNNITCKEINDWVNQKTEKMIPEILNEIPEDAIMYLINALAFEAEWQQTYNENQVREGTFTTEDGEEQKSEFMYGEEGAYLEDEKATGFVKYYKEGKYAFVALLPHEDVSVSEYVESLTGEHLRKMLKNVEDIKVDSAIPKFEEEYSTEMSDVLKEMGMSQAFDEKKADFSGLGSCENGNIYINRVLHKTFISVAEKGTKAGAATAVEMKVEMAMPPTERKTVYLDRPFLYMLIDCEQDFPFFVGTMMHLKEQSGVEYEYKDSKVSIDLPKGWEYETEGEEIRIWPAKYEEGKLTILHHDGLFGVCGTGLRTKKIMLGGKEASQGTYDGDKMWSFIIFTDESIPYVIRSDGASAWWEEYGQEAMKILDSIQF